MNAGSTRNWLLVVAMVLLIISSLTSILTFRGYPLSVVESENRVDYVVTLRGGEETVARGEFIGAGVTFGIMLCSGIVLGVYAFLAALRKNTFAAIILLMTNTAGVVLFCKIIGCLYSAMVLQ